jgi:CheY-like chemotaxis protein
LDIEKVKSEFYVLDEQIQNDSTYFMALRVLLADESTTIKKVFQLALQDFAVEVRPVNIGTDVAAVATSFNPDIIFADVLLQKKNGYDVCAELKGNAKLRHIPIVLMWSGFMELDEDKYQAAQANDKLEKPFDVSALRKLVTDLVPRTQNQRISQFLTFPKINADGNKPAATVNSEMSSLTPELPDPPSMDEDFLQVSIPKIKGDKYRVNLKPEELEPTHIPIEYEVPPETGVGLTAPLEEDEEEDFQLHDSKKSRLPDSDEFSTTSGVSLDFGDDDEPPELAMTSPKNEARATVSKTDKTVVTNPTAKTPAVESMGNDSMSLSAERIEEIVRKECQDIIESVVWKVVPELAKQVIERELKRLLEEKDSHPY